MVCVGLELFKNKKGDDVCMLYYTEPIKTRDNLIDFCGNRCGSFYLGFIPSVEVGDEFSIVYGKAFTWQGKLIQPIDNVIKL